MAGNRKAEILTLLREGRDYVSGQELCEKLGVSRTAVWKAIGQLKKEGYSIEAVQNRGYRLGNTETEEAVYGQNELDSRMETSWAGHPVHFFEEIGSTNIQAKLEAENGARHGSLIVADMQTAGKGRRGRAWSSPKGTNVYFSLILKPEFAPDKASMLTLVMAIAVAWGIERTLGKEIQTVQGLTDQTVPKCAIKWPNDLVVNGKKICGILTEMSLERDYIQYVVIGVGINVGRQDFASEIAEKATSLESECGHPISRSALIANIMAAFEAVYETFLENEDLTALKESYDAMLVNRDREVCVLDPKGEYRGIARGINEKGELMVELPDGSVENVYAGEVSVRGIYGYV